MPWRNWKVLLIIILANYVVFSIVGTIAFPVTPPPAPTRALHPTFTPGALPLERATLKFDTPTVIPTATSITTATISPPATSSPTPTP